MLNDLAKRARSPRSLFVKWSTDFEQRATLIRWFELNLIPGLLQTENYARSLVNWKPFRDEGDATLNDRLTRQSILDHVELRSGSLVAGSVHTETDLIERAARVWDGLHASALPWNQTRDS